MLASLVQLAVLYARLDAGDEGSGPYLHDLVHQAQVQADAAAEGDGVPLQTAPFAIGHYGDAAPVGQAQDLHNLVPVLREEHGVRGTRRMIGKTCPQRSSSSPSTDTLSSSRTMFLSSASRSVG